MSGIEKINKMQQHIILIDLLAAEVDILMQRKDYKHALQLVTEQQQSLKAITTMKCLSNRLKNEGIETEVVDHV